MPTQTLCRELNQSQIEAIIAKTDGAADHIVIEPQDGGELLVACAYGRAGHDNHDAIEYRPVIQDVASADAELVRAKVAAANAEAGREGEDED